MDGIDLSQLFNAQELILETAFNPLQIFLSLLITLLMALFIYFIYKKTYNGVLYSRNFNLTLVMTALVVDAIMMGISGNIILSLGMVGALSIVRFRTAVKDPKDTAFLFWAITIGVINGVAYYELSFFASIFIAIVLIVLSKVSSSEFPYVMIIKYSGDIYAQIESILKKKFTRSYIKSDSKSGEVNEKVIEVKVKKGMQEGALAELRSISGVLDCTLISTNGEFSE